MSDYKWDEEDLVISPVEAVAVYTNTQDEIVIRQRDSMGGEDSLVVFPKESAMKVINAIRHELDIMVDVKKS